MRAYIVTGTTRGIGRAIAENVLQRKAHLFSLSSAPDESDGEWQNYKCDFRCPETLSPLFARVLSAVSQIDFSDIVLINNAGVLEPMGPVAHADDKDILDHLHVNQAAPAILMSAFIGWKEISGVRRRIINISSGAAVRPYAGWAMYCAAKAAIDMMTLCAAAEQEGELNPVKICSVYPGKVETGMQKTIRRSDPNLFPAQPLFAKAKSENKLLSASAVARTIIDLDSADEFRNGCIYDIRMASTERRGRQITPVRSLWD